MRIRGFLGTLTLACSVLPGDPGAQEEPGSWEGCGTTSPKAERLFRRDTLYLLSPHSLFCPLPARVPPVWGPLPWDPFSLLSPQPTHSANLRPTGARGRTDERVLTNPFKRGQQTPLLTRNQAALRRPQRGQVGAGQGAGWTPRVKTYGFMPHGSHVIGPQMMAHELQQM